MKLWDNIGTLLYEGDDIEELLFHYRKHHAHPHRVWFKVLFNPILRIFGWSIVSVFDERWFLERYEIRRYPEHCKVN
jgi:hypothetical protein